MTIQALQIGSFPRISQGKNYQKIQQALVGWKRNEIDDHEFRLAQNNRIRDVLKLQNQYQLDQITDGLIRWYGPLSHLVRRLQHVSLNGWTKYLDTNFYVRQPTVQQSPESITPLIADEFNFASQETSAVVRQILTGPLTLARYSQWEDDSTSFSSQVQAYARALANEVNTLTNLGAQYIQLNEHGLKGHPEYASCLMEAYKLLQEKASNATLSLAFAYGSARTASRVIQQLSVDEIILDITNDKFTEQTLKETINQLADQQLVLGILNARKTRMEDPETLTDFLSPYVEKLLKKSGSVGISANTGLNALTEYHARKKLAILNRTKIQLQNRFQ